MGKGSSGGGGGSGIVDYPDYMKDWHGDALNDSGADALTMSITDAMNASFGNSPWTVLSAYDPDSDIAEIISAQDDLQTMVTLLSSGTTLDTIIASILDDTRIDDEVDAFAADLDARLVSEVLPRFEAGMRDINMVVSSAFVIGRALLEEGQDRQVALYRGTLRNKSFSDDAIRVIQLKLEYQKSVSQMLAEAYRIKIVAKKEQYDVNSKIDEADALWDLELFQYGANLLASIGSGTAAPKSKEPSTAQSMIGGAMTGAAAGAMVGMATGGPVGLLAIGGAILGAASGLL